MPRNEHLVLCGGSVGPPKGSKSSLSLNLHGNSANVRLQIADISKRLLANIPDALVDLLEVASYSYAADSAIARGGKSDVQMGARWRRKFRFVIPVRRPELWSSDSVTSALVETLSFLSEDDYELEFGSLENPPAVERYFEFPDAEATAFTPDEVILFSGGLDSLAGAVEELAAHNKRLALVSHRSATKIAGVQKDLINHLRGRFGANRVMHVPVWANLDGSLGREHTHRTRSFLFAALGAVVVQIAEVIGSKLVDIEAQRVRRELFEPGRGTELIAALLRPEVATASGAVMTEFTAGEEDETEDGPVPKEA